MYQTMYGDKEEKQNAVFYVILSDVHKKLGNTYELNNDLGVLISQTRKNLQVQAQIMKECTSHQK